MATATLSARVAIRKMIRKGKEEKSDEKKVKIDTRQNGNESVTKFARKKSDGGKN